MKRIMVLGFAVLTVAACSSAVRWEKPGGAASDRQRDETECTSLASVERSVTAAQTTGTSIGTPNDPQRTRIQTYDAVVFEECMKTRGYQRVPARPPA